MTTFISNRTSRWGWLATDLFYEVQQPAAACKHLLWYYPKIYFGIGRKSYGKSLII